MPVCAHARGEEKDCIYDPKGEEKLHLQPPMRCPTANIDLASNPACVLEI